MYNFTVKPICGTNFYISTIILHSLHNYIINYRRVLAPVHVGDAGHAEGPVQRGARGDVEDAGDAAGLVILPVHREQGLVTPVSQRGQGVVTCRVLVYWDRRYIYRASSGVSVSVSERQARDIKFLEKSLKKMVNMAKYQE